MIIIICSMAEQWMCCNTGQAKLPSASGSFVSGARKSKSTSQAHIYTHNVLNNEIRQSQLSPGRRLWCWHNISIRLYGIYFVNYSDVQKWMWVFCNSYVIGEFLTRRDVLVDDGADGCRAVRRDRSVPSAGAVCEKLQHVGPVRRLRRLLRVSAVAPAVAENAVRTAEQRDHPLRFSHRALPLGQFATDLPRPLSWWVDWVVI